MADSTPAKDEAFGIVPISLTNGIYKFLLIQHHAGHWGFPKGHADLGEDALQAACREFVEETGISQYTVIKDVSFSEQYGFTREGKRFDKTVVYYPAMVETQAVSCQAEEIRDFAWLEYEAAIARLSFEGAKRVLADVQKILNLTTQL
ncbi:MAG: NUDIX domain-containing protein [Leptolyngbyaceae cyanobacterium bins.302]|nr:NUDIX domain-containing protein [Leptolyngbyaceae cyanobacterium bins.302]